MDCNLPGLLTDAELHAITAAFTTAVVAICALLAAYVTKTIAQWRRDTKWKD